PSPTASAAGTGTGARASGTNRRRRPPVKAPPSVRSPVRIDRTDAALSVRVAAAGADSGRVDLTLRVPSSSRLKVYTGEGELSVEGVPASLVAQTVSGDLRLSLPAARDAAVTAQSLNGLVVLGAGVESAGSAPREVRGKFQATWGAGINRVNLFSGRGRVEIGLRERAASRPASHDGAGRASDGGGGRAPNDGAAGVDESRRERSGPRTGAGERAPVLGAAGRAQEPAVRSAPETDDPLEVGEDEVVRVESDLVTANVSVIERASGRGVQGLRAEDFRLFEDRAEQQIEHFESAEAPFDLLLLLDLSGSTARVTETIRAAAGRFVAATRPQDRVAIITFAGGTTIVSPLTADRAALRRAVARIARPHGDTKLYDSLAAAFDFMARDSDPSRRRAVVLMSDGLDSTLPNVEGEGSALPYSEVLSRAQEFDGVVYTVWTSTEYEAFSPEDIQPETFDLAHDRMAELADAGGGVFYPVERLEDLAGAYERVVSDLGTVYSLSYRPTNRTRDGSWRAIRVTLPRRPEAVARGRRGYFAR
ncbi:MAG TPA: VWA domain-containing protein, partial [Pyrinomonadaceae bacterium]|nr:VWA domain-containing protein [Pyrinomonadaceae bacterium]